MDAISNMSYNMVDIPHFSLDERCGVSLKQDFFSEMLGFPTLGASLSIRVECHDLLIPLFLRKKTDGRRYSICDS